MSIKLVVASTSDKNALSDSDTVTESDDGLTSLTIIGEYLVKIEEYLATVLRIIGLFQGIQE